MGTANKIEREEVQQKLGYFSLSFHGEEILYMSTDTNTARERRDDKRSSDNNSHGVICS